METCDIHYLLGALNLLYECHSAKHLPEAVQQVLINTVQCDVVGWFDVTENLTVRSYDHWLDNLAKEYPGFSEQVEEILRLHPFTIYFLGGGTNRVLRLSDFDAPNEWLSHPLFEPISQCYRARFLLGARIMRPGDGFIALSIGRNDNDFSVADIRRVEEILHHIERHAKSTGLLTSSSKKPVSPNIDSRRNNLTDAFGLTDREAEVAYWAAHGKTNPEIAVILSVSPHTVRTHLQKIFVKMSVETRAALAHTVWSLCSPPD